MNTLKYSSVFSNKVGRQKGRDPATWRQMTGPSSVLGVL